MNAAELTKDRLPEIRNIPVYAADGEQLGHVGDAYYDEESGRLRCVGVAGDALGFATRVIPVEGATLDDRGLHLPWGQDAFEGAPDVADEELDARYGEVEDYYGARSEGGVVRHEEELDVSKRPVEAGRVRLRKWVETQPVEVEVELRRETARVEREQVDRPVPGAELGEQEIEVPLTAEEPVIGKEVVAKERVTVEKGTETVQETLRDEVRTEHVEVEGDVDRDDR